MAGELVSYIKFNGLLSGRQFKFCKYWSMKDQILLVCSEIADLVDDGLVIDIILLDFLKALMWCVILFFRTS